MPQPAHILDELTLRYGDATLTLTPEEVRAAYDEAMRLYNTGGIELGRLVQLENLIGSIALHMGQPTEALDWFSRALLKPMPAHARPVLLNNKGMALVDLGRANEGLEHLEQAFALPQGKTTLVRVGRTRALAAVGRYEEAVEALREAIACADMQHPSDLVRLATVAAELGFRDESIELIARAIARKAGVPLGDADALSFVMECPAEWRVRLEAPVRTAIHQAVEFRGVGHLASHLPVAEASGDEIDETSALEALEWWRPYRDSATATVTGDGGSADVE